MLFPELYRIARNKDASVRDLLSLSGTSLNLDVCFIREAQDWEVESIIVFMDLLYSVDIRHDAADALCWHPSSPKLFKVKSLYKVLHSGSTQVFPW